MIGGGRGQGKGNALCKVHALGVERGVAPQVVATLRCTLKASGGSEDSGGSGTYNLVVEYRDGSVGNLERKPGGQWRSLGAFGMLVVGIRNRFAPLAGGVDDIVSGPLCSPRVRLVSAFVYDSLSHPPPQLGRSAMERRQPEKATEVNRIPGVGESSAPGAGDLRDALAHETSGQCEGGRNGAGEERRCRRRPDKDRILQPGGASIQRTSRPTCVKDHGQNGDVVSGVE